MNRLAAHTILAGLLLLPTACHSQPLPVLPSPDSLHRSIDQYYDALTHAQRMELGEQRRGRWLNYIPSPGYSPFTGGFSLSLNLSAPLSELKFARQQQLKLQSIRRINQLAAADLKAAVTADHAALRQSITEYLAKDSLAYWRALAYNLYMTQYQRNELTPSEWLAKQQDWQSFQYQRLTERHAIDRALLQLLLKAKALPTTDPKTNAHDQNATPPGSK